MKVERRSIFCIRYMPTLRAPVFGSLRDHGRQRDERRRVAGPAALDRQPVEVDVVAGEHDLLARRLSRPSFGSESAIDFSLPRLRTLSTSPCGGCISSTSLELRGDVVEVLDAEGEAHPALGAELVDQERVLRALDVLEQQRRPAGLHDAVGDLRDLEIGVDLGGDANELALALEERDPLAQVGGRRGHAASLGRITRAT